MGEASRCPRCGARESGGSLSGMCASCLLELALGGGHEVGGEDPDDGGVGRETTYRVVTILEADESGTTYLAEQEETRRLVTLHVVELLRPIDDRRRRLFQERVSALQRLRHAAIPALIDARLTPGGDACVVSAFVSGSQLGRHCQSAHVEPAGRARIFARICEAIEHAHRVGAPHGRLGPAQVVVCRADEAAVTPMVTGFSVFPGTTPAPEADFRGLEAIARAMGWAGGAAREWPSIEALRESVCGDFESGRGLRSDT